MATAPPHSPSSSPRLPSPPPMAEDQTGPQSPTPATGEDTGRLGGAPSVDNGASRRIRPGTKAADMFEGPPMVDLTEIDSPFQLTEHLKALYQDQTHPASQPNHTMPLNRDSATTLATPPQGIDRALWLYELCRFLVQRANIIITALFADNPACSAATCPEMRASEWQYLCAVHDPPKSCCAIDYCCHTLDWAANTLTSPKYFPSRMSLSGGNSNDASASNQQHNPIRQLTNIFRRVYRIFAHAWFQHREVFWRVEGRTGLYVFFKTVCDVYSLIPEDNYTIPPEAEGEEPSDLHDGDTASKPTHILLHATGDEEPVTSIPRADSGVTSSGKNSPPTPSAAFGTSIGGQNLTLPPANNNIASQTARRVPAHRQSPSKGSNVATVPEEDEEIIYELAQPLTARLTTENEPEPMESQMADVVSGDSNISNDSGTASDGDPPVVAEPIPEYSTVPEDLAEHPSNFSTTPGDSISVGASPGASDPGQSNAEDGADAKGGESIESTEDSSSSSVDLPTGSLASMPPVVKEEDEDKDRPLVTTGVDSAETAVESGSD